ncbi:MAG: cobalt-precorrin-6A reductase [Methyloceanibacter sp.]|jgi:precorrin-6A/cobalt-precorrin-6A reductase
MPQTKLLILGGSSEAAALARTLAAEPRYTSKLSLAGRTEHPAQSPLPTRSGGFGGAEGLARYLTENRIDVLVDATHPYAAQMKQNAVKAARLTGVTFLAIRRPPWTPEPGDTWIVVADLEAAAPALGEQPKRVLLTTGRKELAPFKAAPQHFYLLRSVEAPARDALPPRVKMITARGPFTFADEFKLLKAHAIEVLVTKNSGGTATAAKLAAARALNLPVVMVRRPAIPDAPSVETVRETLAWLERGHDGASSA